MRPEGSVAPTGIKNTAVLLSHRYDSHRNWQELTKDVCNPFRIRAVEDLESFIFDPEEPLQRSEKGAEKVYAEVFGYLVEWVAKSDREVSYGDILCKIEVIAPGVKRGESVHFIHCKASYGVLKIKPNFENPPVYVFPDDVIALILPWRLV